MITTARELVLIHVGVIDGHQCFEGEAADTGLALTNECWELLGRPNEITVKIRPGDHLNPESTVD